MAGLVRAITGVQSAPTVGDGAAMRQRSPLTEVGLNGR